MMKKFAFRTFLIFQRRSWVFIFSKYYRVEPCADVSVSAAARRWILAAGPKEIGGGRRLSVGGQLF